MKKSTGTELAQSPLYTPENETTHPNIVAQHLDITDHIAPFSQQSILSGEYYIFLFFALFIFLIFN